MKSMDNLSDITKGDNSKSKKGRVVILVCDTSSGPFLPSIIKIFQRVFDLQSGHEINGLSLSNITKGDNAKSKQEAHGPRVAHLSDIATADMQMLCNIFPILSSQLMKRSSFKQFFILKKKIYGMPVN